MPDAKSIPTCLRMLALLTPMWCLLIAPIGCAHSSAAGHRTSADISNIKAVLRIGMSESEVESSAGPPDSIDRNGGTEVFGYNDSKDPMDFCSVRITNGSVDLIWKQPEGKFLRPKPGQ